MRRVLVTGGTGFLGSHLVDRLVETNYNVRVLARPSSSLENIEHHIRRDGIDVVRGDLTEPDSLRQACQDMDMIFHAAAAVDFSLPKKIFEEVNVQALKSLVRIASRSGVRRFVHVSSIGFYGWDKQSIDENMEQHPSNVYEATKLAGEKIVMNAYRNFGLPVSIIEPSFVYGPRARIGVAELFWWVQKKWLPLIDGGKHRLNMVYVSDVVDALILASEKEESIGERFVIGHEESPTYREIMEIVAEVLEVTPPRWSVPYAVAKPVATAIQKCKDILGSRSFHFADYLDYTVQDGVLDIGKAKRILEYCPKVDLVEGMRKTVVWYQERRESIRGYESPMVIEEFVG